MRLVAPLAILISLFASSAMAEQRCGWLGNPTPGNYWLTDADGSWTIMAQGGHQAAGAELMGDISAGDYVTLNGSYGYACACMDVTTDGSDLVTEIHAFRQIAIATCRNDPALPAPG